jgi:hypothetical protein
VLDSGAVRDDQRRLDRFLVRKAALDAQAVLAEERAVVAPQTFREVQPIGGVSGAHLCPAGVALQVDDELADRARADAMRVFDAAEANRLVADGAGDAWRAAALRQALDADLLDPHRARRCQVAHAPHGR